MPLHIVDADGGKYNNPVVLCDHCGAEIASATNGIYQWRFDALSDYPGAPVYFAHKKCCDAFRQANPGTWGAIDLQLLLLYLANGLKLDWKAARSLAARMARLA